MKLELLIETKSTDVAQKTVKGKKDGREYVIREQVGWAHLGKEYPQEIRIPLEQGKEPYAPGRYFMDPSCLYVERFGKLSLGRLRLIPAK